MSEHFPIILIELVLVMGGVLAFGWWQLRDVKREQARRAAARAAEPRAATPPQTDAQAPPAEAKTAPDPERSA